VTRTLGFNRIYERTAQGRIEQQAARRIEGVSEIERAPSDEFAEAARFQLETEIGARQTLARGCGLALIHLSRILEGDSVYIDQKVDPLGLVLIAFAARGRRILRSAYRLLDEGDFPEAVPLLRILSEYLMVGSWLKAHPDRLAAWSLKDLDSRAHILGEVLAELPADFAGRDELERQQAELAEFREAWIGRVGKPEGAVPKVEVMAAEADLAFGYQFAYRLQSRAEVHATTYAVDLAYDVEAEGVARLRPRPNHSLEQFNQYELGAHLLRDLLAITTDHVPGFMWRTGIEGITAALNAARESDPRKHEDPVAAMRTERADPELS
jgi:hypothetical protein